MEFITQQGLCLPGGMWACIVMDQNNATDFHLFFKMEHFAGKQYADDEDLQHAVVDWLNN
jgi:hypothetical protein